MAMPATMPIPVNPLVLAWARRESGHDAGRIAHRLHVPEDKVLEWEEGRRSPTFRQLEALAKFLRRPLSIFFQPAPPQEQPLASEYRRLSGVEPGLESPALRLALRQMLIRRERALELFEELGDAPAVLPLEAHQSDGAVAAASRIRQTLGIAMAVQSAWSDGWQAWRTWRDAVENLGILVFQFPKVPLAEIRGLALLRSPLPVIGINGKETSPEARAFTLVHELVHLLLARGNEEAPALRDRHDAAGWDAVERFAEAVASRVIAPPEELSRVLAERPRTDKIWDIGAVRSLARKFRLTPLAMATRLWAEGVMGDQNYAAWRRAWDAHTAGRPARGGGFAHPVDQALGRGGRPFARLVLDALEGNRISATDAARYLDLKFEHFERLRAKIAGPDSHGGGDE